MNIKEAKIQIKSAITAYFSKDELGGYLIPIEKQRPVFLMGPPGIGKTAIMQQIAQELDVGLVSYSMTHHTRQSALGLPFIAKRSYGGVEYEISEYTMSEIIASIYDLIEETGKTEGILFIDEINCVSETLAPAMLQFLQYKTFGKHRVPDGWIVVTAGNPPEYNKSVREFDIATWDRLKRIDVEPDYEAWREYAAEMQVVPSILTYLDIKKDDFYRIETTVSGKSFVTARGWEDLSRMIAVCEKKDLPVDEDLASQYIQNKLIAKEFAVYYDLFNKYRSDYQIDKILAGQADDEIKARAKNAGFDERLSLLGLLLDSVCQKLREVARTEDMLKALRDAIKAIESDMNSGDNLFDAVAKQLAALNDRIAIGKRAGNLSESELFAARKVLGIIGGYPELHQNDIEAVKKDYSAKVAALKALAQEGTSALDNLFSFCEEVFERQSRELLIVVTELTSNRAAARFISRYGCEKYFEHNKELLFYERRQDIPAQIDELIHEK
ncbi:MAG: AAA family ATPase [Oscillospiraceae bacterium]|nr:AAA family ATPase [Oscillospiraceae bacterium]